MRRMAYWLGLVLVGGVAWAAGNAPGPRELGIYGYVTAVDAGGGEFTMSVAQWRTAKDTACWNPPQARVVGMGATTELVPLGASEKGRAPVRADLRVGRKVYAVGPDPGAKGVLQARRVALEVSAAPGGPAATIPAGPVPYPTAGEAGVPREYGLAWAGAGVGLLGLVIFGGMYLASRRKGRGAGTR
jgi:hypothetical protein